MTMSHWETIIHPSKYLVVWHNKKAVH